MLKQRVTPDKGGRPTQPGKQWWEAGETVVCPLSWTGAIPGWQSGTAACTLNWLTSWD